MKPLRADKFADAAMSRFESEWDDLVQLMEEMMPQDLPDAAFTVLLLQTALAAGLLFPHGRPKAPVQHRRLGFYLALETQQIMAVAATNDDEETGGDALEEYSRVSPQPELAHTLCGQIMGLSDPTTGYLEDGQVSLLMPALKAIVRELCMLPPR